MPFIIERRIFAHDFRNPPAEDRSCDIEIHLINSSGLITLSKITAGIQTEYSLCVSDSSVIGLSSSDQVSIERAMKNLVLAFNIGLIRACLSTLQGDLPTTEVRFPSAATKVSVEQISNEKHIQITETVTVRDTVHVRIITREEVDENQVMANLTKINHVNRFEMSSSVPIRMVNLVKALNAFENAMSTFDRMYIFKSLFNALEFCTNWDGRDRTGNDLDSEVSSISRVPTSDVANWRLLYNRTKHVDRAPLDASQYSRGMETLHSILPPIREASKQLIINRLASI
jgi:hypothetical protein